MKIWHGRDDKRNVIVRFNQKDRDVARDAIRYIESALMPPGYVLDDERIKKDRSQRSGRRLDVTVMLFHNDSREPAIYLDDLQERLEHVEDR